MVIAETLSDFIFLALVVGIPVYGFWRKVEVFDVFLSGAKEGFSVVLRLLPVLVGMVVAIGMLRASGAFDLLSHFLAPILKNLGVDPSLLPLILTRPFSGQASNAALIDIIHHNGADALVSHTAATLIGSTETTFYIVAVYFGVVAIRHTRHAVTAGLIADAIGVIAAIVISHWLLG